MSAVTDMPTAPGAVPGLGHALPLLRDPITYLDSLIGRGDLFGLRLGPNRVAFLCDPATIRKVLVDDRTFDKGGPILKRTREVVGDGLATCPHARHRRQRRLCQPSFQASRLGAYGQIMAEEGEAFAASWSDGRTVAVAAETAALTLRVAVRTMFASAYASGLPSDSRHRITDDFSLLIRGAIRRSVMPHWIGRLPTADNRRYRQADERIAELVDRTIAARRADGVDHGDLFSALLQARDPEGAGEQRRLTDGELAGQVRTFFIAGAETTGGTIAWALTHLATRPDLQTRLQEETDRVLAGGPVTHDALSGLELTARVVTETLRLHPSAWLMHRFLTQDTELAGVALPAGTVVAFSPYVVHRRPEFYPDPDAFDPDRWAGGPPDRTRYMPFGGGPRICIGERFALMESVLVLAAIVSRWRLAPLSPLPVRPRLKALMAPEVTLRVLARDRVRPVGRG
ncbi:cytochrome P450 [Streptomyces sp. NPDC000594]|uniref:cytochrome P450 n=1 Tax=Streptomyces sp. NPDC000594 TaxID=3154261 RepID=UPI0033290AE5